MWRAVLFILLIAAAGGGYFYIFKRAELARVLDGTPIELPATTTKVYKWRDASGHWHITDEPPEANVQFETKTYRSDDNVLPPEPLEP